MTRAATRDTSLARAIAHAANPLTGSPEDYEPLLERIGDARVVLLGEASHGTHEFYAERARITGRLIQEKGFHAVAVEGDWPDCARVNRFVHGQGGDRTAAEALADFRRFPSWMWRNTDVVEFVDWLRAWNEDANGSAVGFYGLDLYSMHASAEAVTRYLDRVDPAAARRARSRYACLEVAGDDPQDYAHARTLGLGEDCENEVVRELADVQRHRAAYLSLDGKVAEDEYFSAERNARLVTSAETYYRTMFRGRVSSWNVRDRHMGDTLEALAHHVDRRAGRNRSKIVVWAHNSHVGDARATWMSRAGELNIGQIARETWGHDAVLVGFTTHAGTVTAASDWGEPAERKRVRPGLPGSVEDLFHAAGMRRFSLVMRGAHGALAPLRDERLERAIGVVYRPDTERQSHYFATRLPDQFDAVLHFDETRAVEPLERTSAWEEGEQPATFPTGL